MAFEVDIRVDPGASKQVIAGIGVELDKLETKGKRTGSSLSGSLAGVQQQLEQLRRAQATATAALGKGFGEMADAMRRTEGVLERIRGPAREHQRDMQALALLYKQGRLSAHEYTNELGRMRTAFGNMPRQGIGAQFATGAAGGLGGIAGAAVGGGVAGIAMAGTQAAMSGIGVVAGLADDYTNLSNRINQVAKSETERLALMQRTKEIANATRSEWASTAETYVRLTNATKSMGLSQERTLMLTQTIGKAFAQSGASASEASAGMLQLTQAFASGKLQGDEFKSLSESVPSVLDHIARAMGVSQGALKQLAAEGKITTDVLIRSFEGAQTSIDNGFAKSAPTLSQQWSRLKNEMTDVFGKFATDANLVGILGHALTGIANAIGPLVRQLGDLMKMLDNFAVLPGNLEWSDFLMGGGGAAIEIEKTISNSLDKLDKTHNSIGSAIPKTAEATRTTEEWARAMFSVGESARGTPAILAAIDETVANLSMTFDMFGRSAANVFTTILPDAIADTIAAINGATSSLSTGATDIVRQAVLLLNKGHLPASMDPWAQKRSGAGGRGYRGVGAPKSEAPTVENIWDNAGPLSGLSLGFGGGVSKVMADIERVSQLRQEADVAAYAYAQRLAEKAYERREIQRQLTSDWQKELGLHQSGFETINTTYDEWQKHATDSTSRVNVAWQALGTNMEQGITSAVNTIADSLSNAALTGEFSFRKMTDAIVADMTRIGFRSLLSFGASAAGLPGFATGGQFMVGGSGGPDSQPIMFKATPGERVTIETPGQQRAGGGNTTVVNKVDDRSLLAALDSPAGEKVIHNVIGRMRGPFGRRS